MNDRLMAIIFKFVNIWLDEGFRGIFRRVQVISDASRFNPLSCKLEPISNLQRHPLISIIITGTCSSDEELATRIGSVMSQTYAHWELWITSKRGEGSASEVWQTWAFKDNRIKLDVQQIDENHPFCDGILKRMNGDYFFVLDANGKLNKHALYWIVRELIAHPDAGIIYTDEDKLDSSGTHVFSHFKPDWNPDLFLTWDYVGSLKVFRTDLVRELGFFRTKFIDDLGYDLAMRIAERLKVGRVRHIPRILYHKYFDDSRRDLEKRTLSQQVEVARSIVSGHLARQAIDAVISESHELAGCLRVRYNLPCPPPQVTLVIPTRNGLDFLRRCIDSIREKTIYQCYDLIIVDNGSDDPATLSYLRSLEARRGFQVVKDSGPFNFSRLNNLAVRLAKGTVVGLLNNDLEVINADWLGEMVSQALRPEIGAVGARLWYPNGTLQHAGVVLVGGIARHVHKGLSHGQSGYFGRALLVQNFVAVTGACLVVRKKIYEEVGGLDEEFAVAFNDVDFCMRVAMQGYRNLWTPYADLYHHESVSRGHENTREKRVRFMSEIERMRARWGGAMFNDPSYNPNLHKGSDDFSLDPLTRSAG